MPFHKQRKIRTRCLLRSAHHHPLIDPTTRYHLRDGTQVSREAMIAILGERCSVVVRAINRLRIRRASACDGGCGDEVKAFKVQSRLGCWRAGLQIF